VAIEFPFLIEQAPKWRREFHALKTGVAIRARHMCGLMPPQERAIGGNNLGKPRGGPHEHLVSLGGLVGASPFRL
jgi:hypothetical protein